MVKMRNVHDGVPRPAQAALMINVLNGGYVGTCDALGRFHHPPERFGGQTASRCRTTARCSEEISHPFFFWKQQQVPPRLRLGPLDSTARAKTQGNMSGTKTGLRLPVTQGSQDTTNQLPTARA